MEKYEAAIFGGEWCVKKLYLSHPALRRGCGKAASIARQGVVAEWFCAINHSTLQSERRQRLSDFDGLQVVEINCRKLSQLASAMWKIRRTVKDHKPDLFRVDVCWQYNGIDYRRWN